MKTLKMRQISEANYDKRWKKQRNEVEERNLKDMSDNIDNVTRKGKADNPAKDNEIKDAKTEDEVNKMMFPGEYETPMEPDDGDSSEKDTKDTKGE